MQAASGAAARSSTATSGVTSWPDDALGRFWALLSETWGRPFVEQNGSRPTQAWREMLVSLDPREAWEAYKLAKERTPRFPPTLAEFELCAREVMRAQRVQYHEVAPDRDGVKRLARPSAEDSPNAAVFRGMVGKLLSGQGLTQEEVDLLPEIAISGKRRKPTPRSRP